MRDEQSELADTERCLAMGLGAERLVVLVHGDIDRHGVGDGDGDLLRERLPTC